MRIKPARVPPRPGHVLEEEKIKDPRAQAARRDAPCAQDVERRPACLDISTRCPTARFTFCTLLYQHSAFDAFDDFSDSVELRRFTILSNSWSESMPGSQTYRRGKSRES